VIPRLMNFWTWNWGRLSTVALNGAVRVELDRGDHLAGTTPETHLLEDDTDIRIIQALLGHDKLDTTARYTRVATGMIASIESPLDRLSQTFRYKDCRADGHARYKTMTLATHEFIRRFLIHVLPKGLHRIRHYGLFASPSCADNIARARELLAVPMPQDRNAEADTVNPNEPPILSHPCPCCGGRMIIIETFERGSSPRHRPTGPIIAIRIDSS
jgi:Putative transposase